MLHTVLFALKLIGCIFLTVLCIAMLLFFAVLFAPIKYNAKIFVKKASKSARINLNFSWVLHLISGRFTYEEKKAEWDVRIVWKRLPSEIKASQKTGATTKKAEDGKKTKKGNRPANPKKEGEGLKREKEESEKKKSLKEKFKEKAVWICDIIKGLKGKTEAAAGFLSDGVHKSAFLKLIKEVKKFLPHMKPEKLEGRVCFGFEDPSMTGKTFGCISMLYPSPCGKLEVIPDFSEKRMEADLVLRGRFRTVHAATLALKLITDKNIRITLSHIQNRSGNEFRE